MNKKEDLEANNQQKQIPHLNQIQNKSKLNDPNLTFKAVRNKMAFDLN